MAKKQKVQPAPQTTVEKQVPQSGPVVAKPKPWSLNDFKFQATFLAVLCVVIYFNSFFNEFAHDDGIVIVKNEYVLEGFNGLKDIFTKDAYDSYYKQLNTTNQLGGGRYRPLSIATFAVEQQFLGAVPLDRIDSVLKQSISYGVSGPQQSRLITAMHVRHVINVLIYALSVVVLLYFLRYVVFKDNPLMAFIAAILFAVHPMHTEVVANVKSRDEIMSLLFMCLTFIFAFKYEDNKKNVWLLMAALGSFLLAFLSKEYAITIVALLPLALIAFRQYSIPRSITAILPYLIIVTVYLGLRLNVLAPPIENMDIDASTASLLTTLPYIGLLAGIGAVIFYLRAPKGQLSDTSVLVKKTLLFLPYFFFAGIYLFERLQAVPPVTESSAKEVLNNPYLFATPVQKLATEIATSLNYLKLLIFPYPLSADYSFNTIPYVDFSNPKVWLSIIVHVGLLVLMAIFFKNVLTSASQKAGKSQLNTAAYIQDGGSGAKDYSGIFLFAIAFYFIHLLLICNIVFDIGATMGERLIYHSSVGFVIAVAYLLVKGYEKIKARSSANLALGGFMAVAVILCSIQTVARNAAWKNDATLFTTDLKTVPNSVLVNANVAASYITIADYQKTDTARRKYLYDAIDILNHTLHIHRTFVAGFLNRGIAWYKLGDVDRAKPNIDTVRSLYPNYPTLPGMYKLISDFYLKNGWESYGKVGRYTEAVEEYKKGLLVDSTNADLWYNMGGAYYTNKQYVEALGCFQRAQKLKPDNPNAQQGVNAALQAMQASGGQPKK